MPSSRWMSYEDRLLVVDETLGFVRCADGGFLLMAEEDRGGATTGSAARSMADADL